jgi:signal transduction histidine kinase/CheY-like chemotaxis protein
VSGLLRARVVYERPQTAQTMREVAARIGLFLEEVVPLSELQNPTELTSCHMLILEQRGDRDAMSALAYSLSSANRDLLVVVLVPHPRVDSDSALLRSGAFDVVDDGPELETNLAHTLAAAARVVALQEERASLANDLAHQEKLSALGVLAAGVSHEINNPCAALLSNLIVLRDQLQAALQRPRFQRIDAFEAFVGDWVESVGDCINATGRIQSIVKTLNVFSRKSDTAPPTSVDINDEVRTVMRLIGKEVRFQARFDVSLAPGMPRILAPPNSVTQIVTNLVVNSLQALETARSESPQVWISTDFDDEHVMLEIGDNGPGILPDVLARIFDPFFTTKPIGKGTGLGLSISRQLVQKMGGEIFAESEIGAGARFSVVLERTRNAAVEVRPEVQLPPASDRLRVLLLDDDELILRSMQRSLATHFECLGLARARIALDALRADHEFDVVVSDVVMPEMNGLEFFSELSHEHPDLAARTLFISGGITSDTLRAGVTDTGRPCLAKPIDVQELIRTIRRVGRPFEELGR